MEAMPIAILVRPNAVMVLEEFSPEVYQEHPLTIFSLMSKTEEPGLVRPVIPATGKSRVQCEPKLQKNSRAPGVLISETLFSK